MSTYASHFLSFSSDYDGTFFDVASSTVDRTVRICVGDGAAYLTPEMAREVSESLRINADRAEQYDA